MPIRVLVADDHAIVRRGIVQIASEAPDISVVGEAEDGPGVVDAVRRLEPDVVILDLNMPGPGGLSVLAQLRSERPSLQVLVLSIHDEEQYGIRFLRAGAAGYLTKNTAPERLVEAVRRVASGRRYVSPTLAEALVDFVEGERTADAHEALSDREFEVFDGLARGQTVTEIADRLALSVKTVSTYRTRLLEKMGLRTNADLARYAVERGLLS